ncbi:MAG: DUF433 domain-containing protein [Bacteroidota bacterium]|nr:DUF433 domain-containing protein [Bacteroidota bacterium]
MNEDRLNRITVNPLICNGKPTIRNIRITVQTILEFLTNGDSIEDILKAYPVLEREDILSCISFALKGLETHKNEYQIAS